MWNLNKVNAYSQYWNEIVIDASPRSPPSKHYIIVANGFIVEEGEIAPVLYASPDKAFESVLHKLKELYPDNTIVLRKPPVIDSLQVEEVLYYICHCRVLKPR